MGHDFSSERTHDLTFCVSCQDVLVFMSIGCLCACVVKAIDNVFLGTVDNCMNYDCVFALHFSVAYFVWYTFSVGSRCVHMHTHACMHAYTHVCTHTLSKVACLLKCVCLHPCF